MKPELYYLQNTQGGYCGNSLMWWAIDGKGYTVDIRCAQVWTQEEIDNKSMRSCDIPHKKNIIDRLVQHHIDHQDLDYLDNDGNIANQSHVLTQHRPDLCK